jgi:hypothetical protein
VLNPGSCVRGKTLRKILPNVKGGGGKGVLKSGELSIGRL